MVKNIFDSELLSRTYISAPCPIAWEDMIGDDKTRHCMQCHLNVYNFQEFTEQEAADLIRNSEGRLCGRIFRRGDGKIATANCPQGIQVIRNAYRRIFSALIALLLCLGVVDSASAQGLVGAPIDPRYGASGMISVYDSPLPQVLAYPLAVSYIGTGLAFLWGYMVKRKFRVFLTSISVVIIMCSAGFVFTLLNY